ncbi:uncharacterized protein LOC126881522 isoform X1 [Diabrotica virgifera virgifera]|uniref:Uncharacterized protein n=1 Tax=Diabrotica virgifera virgifera TaxID=50390 RepID=A0ABM5JV23_DIAVI|nr:uncharacterized protein LOC126881522 isoform X1 [Diabrotica virgifera virgifera]XP_050501786.1 uncharacterized protein LOC126881522 isoform X1 [Diabrotica virgifera virgifera]XP_050501787.1 uncharacterized protein LOC126881522 isoform X1 [Diabrotica virgifera virgifera]XP_050501788.1 uncharacterized protein LOC126881522 isoform X1 [Diabrotica virgifera virgifera]XP_050501789.1 uncharacterized protein LOC126881522 isoform X1 [Diabrotica virgifera virgifera]XP_050501790.1 uncharacterized prot
MQERSPIPHKKICFTVFIVSGLILTVFYCDNTILNYAAPFAAEEIAFVEVQNETTADAQIISSTTTKSADVSEKLTFSEDVNTSYKNTTNSILQPVTNTSNTTANISTTSINFNLSTNTYSTHTITKSTISTTPSAILENLSTDDTILEGLSTDDTILESLSTDDTILESLSTDYTILESLSTDYIKAMTTRTSLLNLTTLPPSEPEYLVSSPKCKIPNYDPFNKDAKRFYHKQKYKPCNNKKLLTYVTVKDNIATLHVDTESVPSYTSNGVTCCYSNITRVNYNKDPDKRVKRSTCKYFNGKVTIFRDPVYVKCLDKERRRQVYENVHAATIIDETIQKKLESFDNTTNPFSILFIGIDSISRLNFIRILPNTHKFVEENGWIPLKGYNKMDDNTFPNLMAILTGFNNSRAYQVCSPKTLGKLDECPMIWYDFRKLGFITGYAEDSASINTFNYRKVGFTKPPVDYYYRPYILGTENLHKVNKDGVVYCTGPETAGERIMNAAKDFATTFKNYPSFGFFWMNSFSHNEVNSPSGMDHKVKHLLQDITNEGITNNSIVIFLSDHGMRFGDIRLTDTGWLEERLPFIYVSFPSWFKEGFPKEYENFKINSNRFTCPYDLHMTLKHILALSGRDYKITPGEACPKCKSLFEEADADRSCADAAIDQHWCTCAGYKQKTLSKELKAKLANFTLNVIHDIIRSRNSDHRCAKYSLSKVLDVRISQNFSAKNDSYVLLQFQTSPKAIFETTVGYIGDINTSNFSLSGDISRLDSYSEHSKCVSDAYLRKYCYCRSNGEKV